VTEKAELRMTRKQQERSANDIRSLNGIFLLIPQQVQSATVDVSGRFSAFKPHARFFSIDQHLGLQTSPLQKNKTFLCQYPQRGENEPIDVSVGGNSVGISTEPGLCARRLFSGGHTRKAHDQIDLSARGGLEVQMHS
jgi:hypothetical protein